jgi:peptide-methionine (S)-S-oxide reductase
MISGKLIAVGIVALLVVWLGAWAFYRWNHPSASCPMSQVIGALGGPSGCAAAPTNVDQSESASQTPGTQTASLTRNDSPKVEKAAMTTTSATTKTETAMFGAGCFWGVEAVLRKIPGVVDTACGYSGGNVPNATYKQVCTHTTGHAEVVKIEFDPSKISYEKLVRKFFKFHDPTQMNRQGPDVGTQYRSVIFYYSPEQKETAEKVKKELDASGKYKAPIATEITKAGEFWRAEEYHQRYFEKTGQENTCHLPPDDDD